MCGSVLPSVVINTTSNNIFPDFLMVVPRDVVHQPSARYAPLAIPTPLLRAPPPANRPLSAHIHPAANERLQCSRPSAVVSLARHGTYGLGAADAAVTRSYRAASQRHKPLLQSKS
ncbi:hypothetical protein DFH09DRAFT_1100067 [Mycena vulgaris]|nr:hypothetical protein DFH09DRAFT_1100067 [Mycena vulgaris]